MNMKQYLACDLGAESGRVMLGELENGKVRLHELHRFPSAAVRIAGGLRWDVLRIHEELVEGLRKAGKLGVKASGVSTDSWGVDYVLLKAGEPCLAAPYHYRDARTDDGFQKVFAKVDAETIFDETGIQFMTLNTIFQLNDDVERRKALLEFSDGFLNIADAINFYFSGVGRAEESLASTTQLYNPRNRQWSSVLTEKLEIPAKIFPEIVPSGTVLGPLLPELVETTGLKDCQVIASCSHDTAAAIAAIPASPEPGWAYLSSGTWSLLGIESPMPVINAKSRELNFTNEAGYGGTTRFLKNIIGLWIIQECRREWAREGRELDYNEITVMAEQAEPLRSLIYPNSPRFNKPGGMPARVAEYCRETGQPVPETPGAFVRCVLESLALLYRQTISELEAASGQTINRLHIVGGGSRNRLLNQFSANATRLPVFSGPVEATAIGNILIQALALGDLKSLAELRGVVAESFPPEKFVPQDGEIWESAFEKFRSLPIE